LGAVAQELREYEQARNDYQQALQICIEFGDRYSQARTYFCLGSLAEAEENRSEARANFQQAIDFGFVILDFGVGAIGFIRSTGGQPPTPNSGGDLLRWKETV
jgi:tetratricopeptide (TPR) repeat protein